VLEKCHRAEELNAFIELLQQRLFDVPAKSNVRDHDESCAFNRFDCCSPRLVEQKGQFTEKGPSMQLAKYLRLALLPPVLDVVVSNFDSTNPIDDHVGVLSLLFVLHDFGTRQGTLHVNLLRKLVEVIKVV
jgi:hypothetical protein